jgi:hypothetical protein
MRLIERELFFSFYFLLLDLLSLSHIQQTTRSIDISPRERIMCHTSHTFVELFSLLALYSRRYIYIYSEFTLFYGLHTHTYSLIYRPRVIRSHHEKNLRGQANSIKYKTAYIWSYHSCAKNIIYLE